MGEPITLYPVDGGDPIIVVAPSYAARLVASGEFAFHPAPPAPLPAPQAKAPAPDVTEAAEEKPAAEKPKATAKATTRRKGAL